MHVERVKGLTYTRMESSTTSNASRHKHSRGGTDKRAARSQNSSKTTTIPSIKPIISPVNDVINKYTAYGWTVIRPSGTALNDLIAQKNKRLHFIQVVTDEASARHSGLAKNTFIQNAFSNSAQPIYAHVTYSSKLNEDNHPVRTDIVFEDVNQNTRVIIGAKKTETISPSSDT